MSISLELMLLVSGEPRKIPSYFPLYCLFNRDPCN